MQHAPGFDVFEPLYDAGAPQFVHAQLVADLETPVSAYIKLKAAFSG